MSRKTKMEQILKQAFSPTLLELTDESQLHAGHHGHSGRNETHFHLKVVSQSFEGLSRIQKHRKIHQLLDPQFASGLHALRIEAYSPNEYSQT